MRIGINAALMGAQKGYRQTGISRYISELVYGLEGVMQPSDKIMLLGRSPELIAENPLARIVWEQSGLPLSIATHRLDVFHGPMHVLPMATRVPGVITIHDLAFLKFPEQLPANRRAFLIAATRLSARKAERVITVSRNTATDVRNWLDLPEEKVTPIPLAPSPRVQPVEGRSLEVFRMKWGVERPYIIAVGTLEPRKNLPTLLRAFASIKDQIEHDLVLVGPKGWLTGELERTIQELHLGDRLRLTGFVSDEELGGWYSGADLFCFPSYYEGFGLPSVEAMRCGTPVLASNTSSFPDVVGDAGVLLSPHDVDAWAETIRALLGDASRLAEMRQMGLRRAGQFSWSRTAEETYQVYQEIAR